jgi:hypothetical protein
MSWRRREGRAGAEAIAYDMALLRIDHLEAEVEEQDAEIAQLRAALRACVRGSKDWMEQAKAALAGKEK